MLFSIIGLVLTIYILCSLVIFIIDFDYIRIFFKYAAPSEIAVFKKEYKIRNKVFDYIAITLFLFLLPFNYYNTRKEC